MYKVFTINKISDEDEIFLAEINELDNVRVSAGGIKVLSGGSWNNITPYVSKPESPAQDRFSYPFVYKNGLIFIADYHTPEYIVQMDNRGFILVRALGDGVEVPKIDGYNYEHNGTDTGTTIQLNANQYALFYKDYKPSIGTLLTSDIENGTGLKVTHITPNNVTVEFYLNIGHGEFLSDRLNNKSGLKYNDDVVRPPYIPSLKVGWAVRSGYQHVHLLAPYYSVNRTPYLDDPNTVSNGVCDRIGRKIMIGEEGGYFIFAFEQDIHDTTRTKRLSNRVLAKYKFDSDNNRWIVIVDTKEVYDTNVYNFDESGDTIGACIISPTGVNEDSDRDLNDSHYAYNEGTNSWESKTFSTSDYSWFEGYRAVRFSGTFFGNSFYVYMRMKRKAGNYTLQTIKYGRYYTFFFVGMYWDDFADVTIPAGSIIAYEVEMWFAPTEQYETTPATVEDAGEDTSFIDNYFKLPSYLTLNVIIS